MWPTAHRGATGDAESIAAAKPVHEDLASQYHGAAGQLSQLTDGAASEAMITAHQRVAVDHSTVADIDGHVHKTLQEVVRLGDSLTACLEQIDHSTHQKIAVAASRG
jgi:hypothetical protein